MTKDERQSLDVAAMQRELLDMAEKLRELQSQAGEILTQKAEVDGRLAVNKAKTGYIKAQMSAVQSVLKSSSSF